MRMIPDELLAVDALQCRQTLHVADRDDAAGVLYGRIVPYGEEVDLLPGLREVFRPAAFGKQASASDHWGRIQLRWAHATDEVPLGKAVELREEDDGLWGRFQITPALREHPGQRAWQVWQSLEDGTLDELSVGFRATKEPTVTRDGESVTIVREKASCHLVEVSVVPSGAYGQSARVESMRAADRDAAWRERWLARISALRSG